MTKAEVQALVDRLRERWEATDAPVAKKINRLLATCREAADALEALSRTAAPGEGLGDLVSGITEVNRHGEIAAPPAAPGFFAGLSPQQKEQALAYRGPENHPAAPAGEMVEALRPFARYAEWGDRIDDVVGKGMFVDRPDSRAVLHLAPGPSLTIGDLRRAARVYAALASPAPAANAMPGVETVEQLKLELNEEKQTNAISLACWQQKARELEAALATAERAATERAAKIAEGCQTFEWKGGDEWAAGYVDGKNAAAAAIRSGEKA